MNFEDMIRACLNNGSTPEKLATEFGGLLNKIQAENHEPKRNEKQEYLDNLEDIFACDYKKEHLTIKDLAILAVLIVQGDYPDWTIEDMQEFREGVEHSVRGLAELQGKGLADLTDYVKGLFFPNKREESAEDRLLDWIKKL